MNGLIDVVSDVSTSIDGLADAISSAAKHLGTGTASTPMGAIECLAIEVRAAGADIADAIRELATAMRDRS